MNSLTAQRMVGSNTGSYERAENDFYPTPKVTTQSLLDKEIFEHNIWECACGKGDMSEVLKKNGYNVFSSDLIDRGFGLAPFDFLNIPENNVEELKGKYDIVTNPPFKFATEFIIQAKKLAKRKVAILGRINLLEGVKRHNLIFQDKEFPLAKVYPFVKRQKFLRENVKNGANLIFFAWFVWDREHSGEARVDFLSK